MPPNMDLSSSFGCLQATLITFGDSDVGDKCSLNPPPRCSEAWNWHRQGLCGQVTNLNRAVFLSFGRKASTEVDGALRGLWSAGLTPWHCSRSFICWHSHSVDFSPGDSEVITGLWWDHWHSPFQGALSFYFCKYFAVASVLPSRPNPESVPMSPFPLNLNGETLQVQGWDPPSQPRGKTKSLLFSAKPGFVPPNFSSFCTSKLSPLFVPYPQGSPCTTSVALETRLRGCFTKEFSSFCPVCRFLTVVCQRSSLQVPAPR